MSRTMAYWFAKGVLLVGVLMGNGCAGPRRNPVKAPSSPGNGANTTSPSETVSSESDPAAESPIVQAIQGNDVATIRDLLAKGADPNAKDKQGVPLLLLALDKGAPDIPRALLDRGARMDVRDSEGETPLLHAVLNSDTATARLLLDYHADPNQPDNDGDLPLNMAVVQYDADLVKLLLERGAKPQAVDKEGDTALSIATHDEDTDLVALLSQPPKPK